MTAFRALKVTSQVATPGAESAVYDCLVQSVSMVVGSPVTLLECMVYEVDGPRRRGRPKMTWREVVEKECQTRKPNTEDAMDRSRWRKLIKVSDDQDGCEWVNVSCGTGPPG